MRILPVSLIALALAGCSGVSQVAKTDFAMAPWTLPTTDGGTMSSESLKGRAGALVWLDPTCADVQDASAWEGALRMFESRWMEDSNKVWIVYVASRKTTDPSYMDGPMWRGWLKEQKLRGSVVLDTTGTLAKQWGVKRVPNASVVDAAGNVRWSGAAEYADDVFGEPDLSVALDSVVHGKQVPLAKESPVRGCKLAL